MPTIEQRIAEPEAELAKLKGEPARPSTPQQRYDPTDYMRMPQSALQAMVRAVPDRLMSDIVADNRHSLEPMSMIAEPQRAAEPTKGSGFSEPIPLMPPPGVEILVQIMDVQDELDKRAAVAKRVDDAMK